MKCRNRRRTEYFAREDGAPPPVVATVARTAAFSDVDPMGYVWFGRYPLYMEAAVDALNDKIGLGHKALREAGIINPVAHISVDYRLPILLGEKATVEARLVWTEATKLQYETVIRSEKGVHAFAWAENVFADAATGEVCLSDPPVYSSVRRKWLAGEFS